MSIVLHRVWRTAQLWLIGAACLTVSGLGWWAICRVLMVVLPTIE